MSTGNEVWINTGRRLEQLDLFEDTALLPTFQANDRTRPSTIQSSYSPEFEVPATTKNHRLLNHSVSAQTIEGQPYRRMKAILASGGVEILPNAILFIKGYQEDRYQLQIIGGNINFVQAPGNKKLSDLTSLSAYDHHWTPENILERLPFDHWKASGYGYEVYDRGKPLDLQNLDPYTLYPSCSANLVRCGICSR
jgi:hypothetical protein